MRIAIIGTGNVGGTLGRRWAEIGHDVVFGAREPESDRVRAVLASTAGKARATEVREAVTGAPVVILATPWGAARDAIAAGGSGWAGRILVDCTNPLQPQLAGLSVGHSTSAGEQIAQWAAGARVVKAFNTTGSGNMDNPRYGGQSLAMFLAGDDAEAKKTVAGLAEELGFEPVDCAPLRSLPGAARDALDPPGVRSRPGARFRLCPAETMRPRQR